MAGECVAWNETPLDDLTEGNSPITYGVVKPGEEGEVPFIRGGDIAGGRILTDQLRTISRPVSEQYRRTLLNGGELLVSLVGNPGQVAIAPPSLAGANIARQVGLVRLRADVDTLFVSYFLRSPVGQQALGAQSLGSVQQVINLRDLKRVVVPLPPLPEQKRIAHILGALDDKIELNRRMNATLEGISRAIFKSWFVDFDPVRQKAAGKQPVGMDAQTAALFPDSFEDSEIGVVPKGWEVGPLSSIATIVMGLSPKSDSYNDIAAGVPLINGPVEFGDYFPVKTKWTTAATRLASPDDLILCVRGSTTGRRVISDGEYAIGRGVCAITATHGFRTFLYETVSHTLPRLLAKTTGSVFPSLSAPDIKGLPVLIPSTEILERHRFTVDQLTRREQAGHMESSRLATLRDTLLPKLLSGEIRVPVAEDAVSEAFT